MANDNVASFAAARPFAKAVSKYRRAGWGGTLPLPAGKKNPPPTGFTGHKAPYPSKEKLVSWLNDPKHKRANICIRLAGTPAIKTDEGCTCGKLVGGTHAQNCEAKEEKYEIVGIDVDHYVKGDKDKRGGDQLEALEARLGKLPDTWISSARVDGKSGIRYYRVPVGLAFRGQVDKDIECIYKGYRFAVVWPSINPDTGGTQYWWFPPGVVPNEEGRKAWDGENGDVPRVADLPLLPSPWLDHLTQGLMRADDDAEIDMDSSVEEIYRWADDTFNASGVVEHDDGTAEVDETQICARVKKSIGQHTDKITNEATSHDKITNAHWEFYRLAAEGHIGWKAAVAQIEKIWTEEVVARDKRGRAELRNEIFRSRVNALRKIKTRVDRNIAIGARAVPSGCTCVPVVAGSSAGSVGVAATLPQGLQWAANMGLSALNGSAGPGTGPGFGNGGSGSGGDGLEYVQFGSPDAPDNYRMNDDGNAQHFVDLFTSPGIGPGIRWIDGYGWIVWSAGSTDRSVQPRWILSTDGLIRRAWQRVRDRQEAFVVFLEADVQNQIQQFTQQNPNVGASAFPAALKALQARLRSWKEFAKASGNNRNAMAALDAAKALPGVTVDINDLDNDGRLIGVANGVIELGVDGVRLRDAEAQDFITLNTKTPYLEPDQMSGTQKIGMQKWEEYLERFLPDEDIRRTAQVALGHCLIGGNPEKIFIVLKGDSNTGKSTMANLCAAALGDYAMTASLTIYQNHKLNPLLAKALTRRMVVTTELSETDKISASMLKRITGGSDLISAELKGSNVLVERVPQFVPIVATNSVPSIEGADKALRNRLYVIPFNVVVSEQEDDKEAATVMKAVGLPAVLHWLVEGYKIYRRERGLPKDPRIVQESDAFASELDTVSTFLSQCVKKHPTNFGDPKIPWQDHPGWVILPDDLYEAYWNWCNRMKVREPDRLSQPKFSRRVAAMGHNKKQLRGPKKPTQHWYGIKLVGLAAGKVTDITAGWGGR
ncbi:DNA primase [Mycobacterium phage Konstantine]|uniref:SF3 helicase domain-containing protein n=1 Tax=Mycobacterium phage Konstantine TaxID=563121 RepID=B5U4W9_9CAUD|nr:DNA primase [Mycobacterium phage Konstantine]ACI12509.1 hypothetical protein KONSTANTINE_94 [Mycobacterium phage Konstantine]